jgi:hypothetical protein
MAGDISVFRTGVTAVTAGGGIGDPDGIDVSSPHDLVGSVGLVVRRRMKFSDQTIARFSNCMCSVLMLGMSPVMRYM